MWTSTVLPWLARYGYMGVALGVLLESAGIPVPGETALVAAAFGAAHGALSLPLVILVAGVASVMGDNIGFAIGRHLGRRWAEQHGHRIFLTAPRLARVDAFFARFGPAAVALARFVTGVRVAAAFAAGTSRMPWSIFLPFNILGAFAWATVVSLAGYAAGKGYRSIAGVWGRSGVLFAVVVPAALLFAWLAWRLARHLRHSARVGAAVQWARRIAMPWLVVVSASSVGVLTFAAVAEEVAERETEPFDDAVRSWVLLHQGTVLHTIFAALTWLGSSAVLGPLAVATAIWLRQRSGRRAAAAAVVTPLIALILIYWLKLAFHRTRPAGALAYSHLGYSFPSGHSTGSMAVAVTLCYVLARERLLPAWTLVAAFVFSLLVGLSRIYLDVHWATDVIGGWAIGMAIAAGGVALYERLRVAPMERP